MFTLPSITQAPANDPAVVLRILQEQQGALTAEHAAAQAQLRDAQVNFEKATAATRNEAGATLAQALAQEADARRRLNMVRDRVLDAQRDVGTLTSGTAVAPGHEQWRIFGLKPTEFYSTLGFVLWFPVMIAFARRLWRAGPSRTANASSLGENPQINRL